MKNQIRSFTLLCLAAAAAAALPGGRAADVKPAVPEEKRELRVLAAPDGQRRVVTRSAEKLGEEKETVAFLGVDTMPVSATTSAQLSLPRGTGLVVNHVVPKSPAVDALKVHDILLKLDDQILIEVRQLAVLIRTHQEGDEVTLTYLRAGEKATAKVKLGKQEVMKSTLFMPLVQARAFAYSTDGDVKLEGMLPSSDEMGGEDWDRVLSLLQLARPADAPAGFVPPAARIRIDHSGGPAVRAMSINTGNSHLVYSDGDGSLNLELSGGTKTLVAKNPKGEVVFSGPVTTPEERKALPADVRTRLEKLESMHDITFRTDGSFKGTETKVVRPRGVSLPLPAPARSTVPGPSV